MELNVLIRCVAYFLYIVLLATWPLRKKKQREQLGKCVLPLHRHNHKFVPFVLIIAPLLIVLQRFRDFGIMINLVLCMAALLAAEVVIRDKVYDSLSGVYENGIIVDGRYLLFSQIVAFPTLEYEEETNQMYPNSLKVVTENTGVIYVGFVSKEEREQAIKVVLELQPRLAPSL